MYWIREHYYAIDAPAGTIKEGRPCSYHPPIFSTFSVSKEVHLRTKILEHDGYEVFGLIGGPLFFLPAYLFEYEGLPHDSFTVQILIDAPCDRVVEVPCEIIEGECEECVGTRIRVRPEKMILRLDNGTEITPSSFETFSTKEGYIPHGAIKPGRILGLDEIGWRKHWGRRVEIFYLELRYTFPPTDMKNLKLIPAGISLAGREQIFPPLHIQKSAEWRYSLYYC
jgi:hypothetical protein